MARAKGAQPGAAYMGPLVGSDGGEYREQKVEPALCVLKCGGVTCSLPWCALWWIVILVVVVGACALSPFRRELLLWKARWQPASTINAAAYKLAEQVGDSNAPMRGREGNEFRDVVHSVFQGTHVEGQQFGPVALSPNASALRAALQQRGFSSRTLYHGTKLPVVPSILNTGLRYAHIVFHGPGIYASGTLSHAECYSGDGQPIIYLQVFFHEENKKKYMTLARSGNEMEDTYIISDPLLIFPISVHRCCEVPPTCI
mmetsp:Transcript_104693/g.223806  ORF Transcript_104693/g.223806 Transcript_104693/m.223806 type:complete len:258 (-) Transcript_104693:11-784(-)